MIAMPMQRLTGTGADQAVTIAGNVDVLIMPDGGDIKYRLTENDEQEMFPIFDRVGMVVRSDETSVVIYLYIPQNVTVYLLKT